MIKQQRLNIIRYLLLTHGKVIVADLSRQFDVTERTIRRDLKVLSDSGVAELFFGGAKLLKQESNELLKQVSINTIMNSISNKYYMNENHVQQTGTKVNGVYILGSFNIDIVTEVANFPRVGETIHSLSTEFYAGGKGSNQATAAAKINPSVHLTVKIGKDEFGSKARQYFGSTNIHTFTILEDEEKHTGNASIFVAKDSGDNFIAIDLGANQTITSADFINEMELIQASKVFLTQLENNFDATKVALEFASKTRSFVILNPAPYDERVKSVLHLIDLITPNETEAQGLSGIEVTNLDSAKLAAKNIYDQGARLVLITLGSNGALLFDGDKYSHFPAYKAVVTDTSGAGDSFNGALAACLANGETLDYSIKFASAYASLAVERKGASNMPDPSLALARLQEKEN